LKIARKFLARVKKCVSRGERGALPVHFLEKTETLSGEQKTVEIVAKAPRATQFLENQKIPRGAKQWNLQRRHPEPISF
jgi:hypothetical protein